MEIQEPAATDQQQESSTDSGEEGKGVKRKREEMQSENEKEGSSQQVMDLKFTHFAFSIEWHNVTGNKMEKKVLSRRLPIVT